MEADNDVAISQARLIWLDQAETADWFELDLDESLRALIEDHFVIGVLDRLSEHWDVPTEPPMRAFLLFLGYTVHYGGVSLKGAKSRLPMLSSQHGDNPFLQGVFELGRSAIDDGQALTRIIPEAVRMDPLVRGSIWDMKKRSLLALGLAAGIGLVAGAGLHLYGVNVVYNVGGAFLIGLASLGWIGMFIPSGSSR